MGDSRFQRPGSPRSLPSLIDSALLERAYTLAVEAHGSQRRATDQRLFVEHVVEVAVLLHFAGLDEELIAVGLLHDAIERGTATEAGVRAEMGDDICSLVMKLTEDRSIESFEERKQGLRDQVRAAGPRAIAVFAADKLSDIRGLQRGIDGSTRESIEARMGTTIAAMAGHYRESVEMIEASDPSSCFIAALHQELRRLTTPPK
jgi:guanosine-3',5'-bis(diphosphate) 3'-pyrophosphohydrolase